MHAQPSQRDKASSANAYTKLGGSVSSAVIPTLLSIFRCLCLRTSSMPAPASSTARAADTTHSSATMPGLTYPGRERTDVLLPALPVAPDEDAIGSMGAMPASANCRSILLTWHASTLLFLQASHHSLLVFRVWGPVSALNRSRVQAPGPAKTSAASPFTAHGSASTLYAAFGPS
jgi:hypothetical protein